MTCDLETYVIADSDDAVPIHAATLETKIRQQIRDEIISGVAFVPMSAAGMLRRAALRRLPSDLAEYKGCLFADITDDQC